MRLISFYQQCTLHIKIFAKSTSGQIRTDNALTLKNRYFIATKYMQFI